MGKSAGQWIGTVVGGVIGFFAGGNVALGASIGGMIGGAIDPPKGPKIEGPRLNDLSVQTSTYGAQIPVMHGTVATFGNIFWVENNKLKETKKTEEQGGKGGGGQEVSTYSYSATFALGLCLGPVDGIGRIWCSGKLIADFRDSSLSGIMATNLTEIAVENLLAGVGDMKGANPENTGNGAIRFYNGSSGQQPDSRMQATLGVANTPAYRGLAYLVFEDFQLEDFGNSLMGAQFKVEVVETASVNQYAIRTRIPTGLFPDLDGSGGLTTAGPYNPVISNGVMQFDKERDRYAVTLEGTLLSIGTAPGIAPGSVGDPGERYYVGTTSGGYAVYYNNSGPFSYGYLVVGANTQFAGRQAGTTELQGACVGSDGNLYLHQYKDGACVLEKYDGGDLSLVWTHAATELSYSLSSVSFPYMPGTTAASAVNEAGTMYWFLSVAGQLVSFDVHMLSPDGDLTHLHTFTSEGGTGWPAYTICPSATGSMCAITHQYGGFYVFDATPIVVPETVLLSEIVSSLCLASNMLTAGDIDVTALTQEVRGYRITATAAIRAALEPLQACWPFDALQHGYQIKFVPRGGASVATVSADDLGAVSDGDNEVIRLSVSREMDSQLARRVETTFIDAAREYDIGTGPGAERLNTDAVNILQIELPVVLVADEAAGIEQTLLYLYWLERNDLSFVLPPTYLNIEPADVITVTTTDATHLVRITRIQYLPDGRLECAAKYNHSPIYTPVAVGETGAAPGQVLSYNGPTQLALLDVPCIDSTIMDQPGLLAATTGVYSGWPGATLLRSDDSGQTWTNLQGFVAPGAVMGYATAAIGTGATNIVDTASLLNVRTISGALATVTEAQMFNGSNHFAYGAHGRWEIIAAKTVTAETDGTYTLQNLMRGRFGTEQFMATHGATDSLVLLDSARVRFIGMNIASINLTRSWRAVTRGALLDSATDTDLAYSGANLECLSPCYLSGNRDASSLDWTVSWTRRTRLTVEPFAGVAAPLGETTESYEVEVWDPTFTTLKRTITGLSSPSCPYTYAQQVVDFAASVDALPVRVYQLSANVGRGYPLQGTASHVLPADPYLPLRVFGMHFNGTDASTTFTEWSGKTFTAFGNAKLSTTNPKYGSACGSFDGTGDYIKMAAANTDFDPGSGDYGFGGWTYPTTLTPSIQTIATTLNGTTGWALYLNNSGQLVLTWYGPGAANATVYSSSGAVSVNTWQFIWWSKSGTTFKMFVGTSGMSTQVADTTSSIDFAAGGAFNMGRFDNAGTTGRDFTGKMDDFTAYKGTPKWTASFLVPTQEFPDT